jgi:hypothetical protein
MDRLTPSIHEALIRPGEPGYGAKVTVAYIAGSARCGSTLLDLLLGQLSGFVAVGSLGNLWERGLRDNNLCGCGLPFLKCPFWERVGREAFGGWDTVDPTEVLRLQSETTRYRHLPWLFALGARPSFFKKVQEYSEYMRRLYEGIRRVSGCSVVVDSSKDPMDALILRGIPALDARVVHLIRDSRGVAYSWSKWLLRPEYTKNPTYMPRYGPVYASIDWIVTNLSLNIVGARSLPLLSMRYESFVQSPKTEIERIADFLGAKLVESDLAFLEGGSTEPVHAHTVSGNPMRFEPGRLQIRLDDEWRTAMRLTDRMIVSLLTWPFLLAYGYLGRPASALASSE